MARIASSSSLISSNCLILVSMVINLSASWAFSVLISSWVLLRFAPIFIRLLEMPLDTKQLMEELVVEVKIIVRTLTTSWMTCLEKFSDWLVHLNLVLFLGNLLMSLFHLDVDPILEWLSHYGVDDIGNVVPRKPVNLSLDKWKCKYDRWVVLCKFKHWFDF